ncbi:MAG: hypothetical protein GY754_16675 [bacterium]|nr:hypothetical protein [bacterium]
MKKFLVLFFLLASIGVLFAGYTYYGYTVTINQSPDGSGWARGVLSTVRNSSNTVEYISCGYTSNDFVSCSARDSSYNFVAAWTSDASMAKVVQGMGDNTSVYFQFDSAGTLTYLSIERSSKYLP